MTPQSVVAECYFLDVGQGTCQVLDLGNDAAIVIDTGPYYPVLHDLLRRRLGIKQLEAIILSHNHHDHIGALPGLLRNFRRCIKQVFVLQDGPAQDVIAKTALEALRDEVDKEHCPLPIPLIKNRDNHVLYQNSYGKESLTLELLFPSFFENLTAQTSGDPNRSSAVILCGCGTTRILFPGDAEIEAWKQIHRVRNMRPISCDVIAVPHHAGQVVRQKVKGESDADFEASIEPELNWLYSVAIQSKTAIISAGSANPHDHPIAPHVRAVNNSGACVMCTQITPRCASNLESLRPGVLPQDAIPRRSRAGKTLTARGASAHVACAGTVLVQIRAPLLRIGRKVVVGNQV